MKITSIQRRSVNQLAAVIDGRDFLIHSEDEIPAIDERGIREAIQCAESVDAAAEPLAIFGAKLVAK